MSVFKKLCIGPTNCFLIPDNKGYLLIDTGWPGRYCHFLNILKRIHINISEINLILLTHHHYDHIGNLNQIVLHSQARVMIHSQEVQYLKNRTKATLKGTNFTGKLLSKFLSKFHSPPQPFELRKQDIILTESVFPLHHLGIEGIVLHTPGHTLGSISLIFEGKFAFVGDTIMNLPFTSPLPLFAEDLKLLFKSWERILSYNPQTIYPAHGNSITASKLYSKLKNIS